MQAASEVLDAKAETEELRQRLLEATGPEGAPSRRELEEMLEKVANLA